MSISKGLKGSSDLDIRTLKSFLLVSQLNDWMSWMSQPREPGDSGLARGVGE